MAFTGRCELEGLAVGQQAGDARDIVDHLAVAQGACAAGVVAGHAAKRAAGGGRGLHREEQSVALDARVQPLEHHARLDDDLAGGRIVMPDGIEVAAAVNHQPFAQWLAVLRGARAAHDHRRSGLGGDLQRGLDIRGRFREDHAGRHDLVDRRVGAVTAAREGVEVRFALQLSGELGAQFLEAGTVRRRVNGHGAGSGRGRRHGERFLSDPAIILLARLWGWRIYCTDTLY